MNLNKLLAVGSMNLVVSFFLMLLCVPKLTPSCLFTTMKLTLRFNFDLYVNDIFFTGSSSSIIHTFISYLAINLL